MIEITKIDDNRYCCACGTHEGVYQLLTSTPVLGGKGLIVEKTIPLCKSCLIELKKVIEEKFK